MTIESATPMSPLLVFLLDLAAKMALTAIVVVVVSVTVERSGPFVGALIAALPTAAGAAYIILAVEHPPDFIAASAVGSIASSAGVAIFALIYTVLAQQRGLIVSLGTALLVWFAIAVALRLVPWTPLRAMVFYIAVFAVTIPLSWRYRTSGPPAKFLRRAYDIPLRALTAAIVVATVTTASYALGSFLSGVFAVFPIVMASSVVILHPRVGGVAAASMFAHAQIALPGLGFGFLVLHYLAEPIGSWWALVVTLATSIAWSGLLWLIRPRKKV
jgi:uncharacterized membrane protein (GlpM family)